MRIIFAGGGTGGHLYPGLAVARALVRLNSVARPFFIGAERGVERDVLPKSGFPHALLDLHPLYRSKVWQNWRTVSGLAGAWTRLGAIVREERPAVVIGTGGYASGATLAYAVMHRIPIALQEQNSFAGMTTRLLSRYASEIYLGYLEAARSLRPRPGAWVEETGNPIEPPPIPRPERDAARRRWGFPETGARVLLVFGGSQGAKAINRAVDTWLARGLPSDLCLIWGTGRSGYDEFAHRNSDRVRVLPYLSPIEDAYAACDLALTRAGALTLAELCAWGIPSVLVPLPTAAADHQTANARALEKTGAAIHLPQRELDADRLDRTLRHLLEKPARLEVMATAARQRGRPDAAEFIARRILKLAHLTQIRP